MTNESAKFCRLNLLQYRSKTLKIWDSGLHKIAIPKKLISLVNIDYFFQNHDYLEVDIKFSIRLINK